MKYGRIIDNKVVETFTPPEGVDIADCMHPEFAAQFQLVPEEVQANWQSVDGQWQAPEPLPEPEPPAPVARTRVTKRAFQERFPKLADGISTKFDAMTMFLSKDSYAESLEPDAQARVALQLLITTGLNRINASAYVDLALPDATMFTALLLQPSIPAAFRLTPEERAVVLNQVVAEGEAYAG